VILRALFPRVPTASHNDPASNFLTCDSGATAIEYALAIAGIALVMVAALDALGARLIRIFLRVGAGL